MAEKLQVFAVMRWDSEMSNSKDAFTVKEVLPTQVEAEAEVERLNKLNEPKGAHYFWQATRYFPGGRKD